MMCLEREFRKTPRARGSAGETSGISISLRNTLLRLSRPCTLVKQPRSVPGSGRDGLNGDGEAEVLGDDAVEVARQGPVAGEGVGREHGLAVSLVEPVRGGLDDQVGDQG